MDGLKAEKLERASRTLVNLGEAAEKLSHAGLEVGALEQLAQRVAVDGLEQLGPTLAERFGVALPEAFARAREEHRAYCTSSDDYTLDEASAVAAWAALAAVANALGLKLDAKACAQ